MRASFTKLTVSGSLEFEGMSFVTFQRLMDFIEAETKGSQTVGAVDMTPEASVVPAGMDFPGGTPVHVYEKPEDMIPAGGEPVEADEAERLRAKYSKVQHYGGWETVIGIFIDAEIHPEKYRFEWQTAKTWMKRYAELVEVADVFKVSHVLGSMAQNDLVKRSQQYNQKSGQNEVLFYCPLRIEDEASREADVMTEGRILRNARLEEDLTVNDLADLTGYSADIISKWENDRYSISTDGKAALKSAFGKDIFANAKEEN